MNNQEIKQKLEETLFKNIGFEHSNLTETDKRNIMHLNIGNHNIENYMKSMIESFNLGVTLSAENAESIDGWNTGFSGSASSIDKDSILKLLIK